MKYNHIIFLARACPGHSLVNAVGAKAFLDELAPPFILEKKVLRRKNGLVAFFVTEHEHVILTTNPLSGQAFLEIRSRRSADINEYLTALQKFAQVRMENITFREFTDDDYQNMECQEPRCSRLATKEHNGLRLCRDCYEAWLEKEAAEDELKYRYG